MTIVPAGPALGAEIRGVDLRTIGEEEFAGIHRALLDHLVLLFRGQKLGDEDLISFSRRLGISIGRPCKKPDGGSWKGIRKSMWSRM